MLTVLGAWVFQSASCLKESGQKVSSPASDEENQGQIWCAGLSSVDLTDNQPLNLETDDGPTSNRSLVGAWNRFNQVEPQTGWRVLMSC